MVWATWLEGIFLLLLVSSGLAAYYLAKSYLLYGFEKNHFASLIVFIAVCVSSLGLLEMLVIFMFTNQGNGNSRSGQ